MEKRIVITGGSGLIGTELKTYISQQGYEVRILSRSATNASTNTFHWDPEQDQLDLTAFENCYAVINLAGKSLLGCWTESNKQKMRDSRIKNTQFLVRKLIHNDLAPTHFIQASAIGYYGDRADTTVDETSSPGTTFMANLCREWEAAAEEIVPHSTCSIVRIGLYLHPAGGVYQKLNTLSKFFLAASLGRKAVYTAYTHYKEFNTWIEALLGGELEPGSYNAVGKHALSMNELIKLIAKSNGRKVILPPIPTALIKLGMGQTSETLLHSTRVISSVLPPSSYLFNTADEAVEDLVEG